jgi:hypothetical protein
MGKTGTGYGFFWKLSQDRSSRKLIRKAVLDTIPESLVAA